MIHWQIQKQWLANNAKTAQDTHARTHARTHELMQTKTTVLTQVH